MTLKGNYDTSLEEVLNKHGRADIIAFMFYAQPGVRDMAILHEGIEDVYRGDYYVNITEIDDDLAAAFNTERGWKITFMFDKNVKEDDMEGFLSVGLETLRVNYKLIESSEVVQNV